MEKQIKQIQTRKNLLIGNSKYWGVVGLLNKIGNSKFYRFVSSARLYKLNSSINQ